MEECFTVGEEELKVTYLRSVNRWVVDLGYTAGIEPYLFAGSDDRRSSFLGLQKAERGTHWHNHSRSLLLLPESSSLPSPSLGTIHIQLPYAQVRVEGRADPGLLRVLLECLGR